MAITPTLNKMTSDSKIGGLNMTIMPQVYP